jgi:multicomponent Na+:H+ antiporter subunit F
MIWILAVAGSILAVAAGLTLWRMVAGPSHLDRIVAADVMVAIVIAAIGLIAVWGRSSTGLPIVLGLSLMGFTGAVGVARLLSSPGTVRRLFDRRKAMREEDPDDA